MNQTESHQFKSDINQYMEVINGCELDELKQSRANFIYESEDADEGYKIVLEIIINYIDKLIVEKS